jgi:hypothetical protein
LITWTCEEAKSSKKLKLQIELYQIKVGKKANYVKESEVDVLLEDDLKGLFRPFDECAQVADYETSKFLVTSRKVSGPLSAKLEKISVSIERASTPALWGPRVKAYCVKTGHKLFS